MTQFARLTRPDGLCYGQTTLDQHWEGELTSSFAIMKNIGLAFLVGSVLMTGQTTSTSISGIVFDPSGATAVGVDVTIENVGRGLVRRVATNEAGFYSAPALDPGRYNISVEKAGFKKNI